MKYRKALIGLFSVGVMAVPVVASASITTGSEAGGFKGMSVSTRP